MTTSRTRTGVGGRQASLPAPAAQARAVVAAPAGVAAVAGSAADAIVTTDLGGAITGWNAGAERLYGYTEDEALGRTLGLVEPPARRQRFGELVRAVMGCSRALGVEVVRWRKDGSRVEMWLTRVDVRARPPA